MKKQIFTVLMIFMSAVVVARTATDSTTYYGTELILNGNFDKGYTDFITDYRYSPYNLEPEGVFAITKNPNMIFSFLDGCHDHTNGSGFMMVINGDTRNWKIVDNDTLLKTVWGQETGVFSFNAYEFSFWYSSVYCVSPAILDVYINDELVSPSSITFSESTCDWKQYSVIWYSADTSKAFIKLVNRNKDPLGNDFALDDISFKPLCTINASAGSSVSICPGEIAELQGNYSLGESPYSVSWFPTNGLSNPTKLKTEVNIDTSQTYYFIVKDGLGCIYVDSVFVEVYPLPKTKIHSNKPDLICPCDSITFYIEDDYHCRWSTGETSKSITLNQAGNYFLTITDDYGCSSSFSKSFDFYSSEISIMLDQKSAAPGEKVVFPINLEVLKNIIECGYTDFKAKVKYNKTLLLPSGSTPTGRTYGNTQEIEFNINAADLSANRLEFIAALGDSECTDIEFDVFAFNSECEDIKIHSKNGRFCLNGICKEAGKRLIKVGGKLNLMQNYPNPFTYETTIKFTLIENGATKLYLANILGQNIRTIFDGYCIAGDYEKIISAAGLPAATYFLVLQTPINSLRQRIEIIR